MSPSDRPRRRDRATDEQQRAINIIACWTLLEGRSPTLTELARLLGKSRAAAVHRLHWMEKKGLWRREPERGLTELGLRSALGLVT